MKTYRTGHSTEPFPSAAPFEGGDELDARSESAQRPVLPDGWKQISVGLRGARLYRFTSPVSGGVHWQAEMTLNGKVQRRRCASELYARWWLAVLDEPHMAPRDSDWEELNVPLRSGFAGR